jgi:hypothetical protein
MIGDLLDNPDHRRIAYACETAFETLWKNREPSLDTESPELLPGRNVIVALSMTLMLAEDAWTASRRARWSRPRSRIAATTSPVSPRRARAHLQQRACSVGPMGIKAVYRKLHLFEREREWFSPGDLPLEVHRVGPARVGMLICFDWRFRGGARAGRSRAPTSSPTRRTWCSRTRRRRCACAHSRTASTR